MPVGGDSRIKHVIYIIKENRTYDQILGDLKQDGKPVGNGDPKWAMYGESITPNEHKLALQFGVLDNFFDSGEVSGDGHVWSNAAIGTDYLEKTWQQQYRGAQRTYDYEGVVASGYPLLQKIPDVKSRPAAISGAISPRTARPTTTSASSSPRPSATRPRSPMHRSAPCLPGPNARARPLLRASRCPRSGAAA